jgi:hypothetical protein
MVGGGAVLGRGGGLGSYAGGFGGVDGAFCVDSDGRHCEVRERALQGAGVVIVRVVT